MKKTTRNRKEIEVRSFIYSVLCVMWLWKKKLFLFSETMLKLYSKHVDIISSCKVREKSLNFFLVHFQIAYTRRLPLSKRVELKKIISCIKFIHSYTRSNSRVIIIKGKKKTFQTIIIPFTRFSCSLTILEPIFANKIIFTLKRIATTIENENESERKSAFVCVLKSTS
jgi:hypothetical protein